MYESQTYELILHRMLDRVPTEVDKREGSIIYDALAPAALELSIAYASLDINLNLGSGQTATGSYLDLRTMDYGITRREATKAVHEGIFLNTVGSLFDIPIGSRFASGSVTLMVSSRLSLGHFELTAEMPGSEANLTTNTLLPIDYITNLGTAQLGGLLVPGTDIESDDKLRERYLQTVRTPSTSGNKADYRKWALEVNGIGDAAVLPLWNGPGTVKVILLDANKLPASSTLVDDVQAYIAPTNAGEGKAPIGATVNVVSAVGISINVTAALIMDGTRTAGEIINDFKASLTAYLKSIAYAIDPSVKYVRVGSLLLDTDGVKDYSGLLVNGGSSNVTVASGSVAVLGKVSLS
ncbi:phage tail protein [Paenibacillus baekrokdamisoli]|uniref:Phage tail protein n=1 Tax=Paenibacillus baekrokdamisoli TaxID=1712516 RepID=A0A3G9INH4_9BACL|nr:baseplate J/gp47 family protein [Paenibacillus baekrokdamisoli]MBB3070517.1 putative phage protein gp47/JayE [Paenibacillus baekrokdamisoli]BBH19866.1 phage tail protein [Paenibacillus baekrokdamisoli]